MNLTDKAYNLLNINELPPPISDGDLAGMKRGQVRVRLTEKTYALLEHVIDTAQRLGLRLNTKDQSILMSILRGDSYKSIAQDMDTTPREAVERADHALQQLHLFLNRLHSDEEQQQDQQQALQSQQEHYQQRIQELESTLATLREPEHLRRSLLAVPIHKLPISRPLQSVLLGAGHYALADILNTTREELQRLPNMTPPLLQELHQYLRSMGMNYRETSKK